METRYYYVSVVDGSKYNLLAGPFGSHEEAKAQVGVVRKIAIDIDPKAHFFGFGTCKTPEGYDKPGLLNKQGLV